VIPQGTLLGSRELARARWVYQFGLLVLIFDSACVLDQGDDASRHRARRTRTGHAEGPGGRANAG
jgi:hypothetical protein